MNPNVRQVLFGMVFFVAGLSLGWITGTVKSYNETAAIVAESDFKAAAADLNSHISLLRFLHDKDYSTVSEKLEELVDKELVTLANYPTPVIPSEDKVIEVIVAAKQYRDKYPITGRSAETSSAIGKAFEKAVTRGEQ